MIKKKRLLEIVFTGLLIIICLYLLLASENALAQKEEVNLEIRTSVTQESYNSLRPIPVMISVKDGELAKQREAQLNSTAWNPVPSLSPASGICF
jgi:hypothetical protein